MIIKPLYHQILFYVYQHSLTSSALTHSVGILLCYFLSLPLLSRNIEGGDMCIICHWLGSLVKLALSHIEKLSLLHWKSEW